LEQSFICPRGIPPKKIALFFSRAISLNSRLLMLLKRVKKIRFLEQRSITHSSYIVHVKINTLFKKSHKKARTTKF
jgi:hypothetical protein